MESYSVTKKASTTDTGTTMAEFQKHDAEWKKKKFSHRRVCALAFHLYEVQE